MRVLLVLLVIVAASEGRAFCQNGEPSLFATSWRETLAAMELCVPSGEGRLQLNRLQEGLNRGWNAMPAAKRKGLEPEYLKSLREDLRVCRAVAAVTDSARRKELQKGLVRDLSLKADDCQQHGMSRLISVEVKTVRAGQVVNGWEVFYKWDCASSFQTDELRAPVLSSPAVMSVPPGEYLIYARKSINGVTSSTPIARFTAFGPPKLTFELTVP